MLFSKKFHNALARVLILAWGITGSNFLFAQDKVYKRELLLMSTRFEFTVVNPDSLLCRQAVEAAIAEINRIENVISEWKPDSEASKINDNAGIQPVKVSREMFDLIARSIKVSELTDGAFDISFAPMNNIYYFDKQEHAMPSEEEIDSWVKKVGYKKIILDKENQTVFLPEKGMRVGFGGIGQGYGAHKAKELMIKMDVQNGVIDASGDIIAWGKTEEGKNWDIGIGDPKNPEHAIAWLEADNMAVVTSGNYEKYFSSNGIRYGHIINPATGYPVTGVKSVTIVCPDVELADALSTGVFVLGEKKGLELVEQLNGIECIIVNDKDEMITSSNLQLNYYSRK